LPQNISHGSEDWKLTGEVCSRLPDSGVGRTVSEQLTDSSTSMSANYRAACRARSHAEFVSKIVQVEEEADESLGWLEFIVSSELMKADQIEWELRRPTN
jgi:four helix bundle protein